MRIMKFSKDDGFLYDVLAVSLSVYDDDGNEVKAANEILWIDKNHNLPNAEAIEYMAIARQGVADRFFTHVPHGSYEMGEKYVGRKTAKKNG